MSEAEEIARRKGEHLRLAAEADVETRTPAGWDDVNLVHDALPEIDAADVDLRTTFLGHRLSLPLVISGMTGGHGRALAVNELLARVAERHGIAMGVGSQRAAIRDPMLAPTYSVRPFWVTQAAIPVKAGSTYRFSVWAIRPSLATALIISNPHHYYQHAKPADARPIL